jgi:hypothetical protein
MKMIVPRSNRKEIASTRLNEGNIDIFSPQRQKAAKGNEEFLKAALLLSKSPLCFFVLFVPLW